MTKMNSETLNTQLMKAIKEHEIKKAEDLIQQGADPNMKHSDGNTPLIMAIQSVQPEMVKLLIDYNVDVNKKGHDNKTPFFWAAYVQCEECAELLIKAGARTNKSLSVHTGIYDWDKYKNQQIKTFVKKVLNTYKAKKVIAHQSDYRAFSLLRYAACQQKIYD